MRLLVCAAAADVAIVINIVNIAGSLDACRVVIVMGIIRVGSGKVCGAVLVYVGLTVCIIFL